MRGSKGRVWSQKTRERISKGVSYARRKRGEASRLGPGELRALERSDSITPRLVPFVHGAQAEALEIAEALGGSDLSPQRLALVRDFTRLGILTAALVSRALQRPEMDLDEVSKIKGLIDSRRAHLGVLGLNRRTKDVMDLPAYIEAHSEPSGGISHEDPGAFANGDDA